MRGNLLFLIMYGSLNFPVSENVQDKYVYLVVRQMHFEKFSSCMQKILETVCMHAAAGNQLTSGRMIKIYFCQIICVFDKN